MSDLFDPWCIAGYKRTKRSITFASVRHGYVVAVPSGFVTDGYSLPLGLLFSPWSVPEPAVLHDWMYCYPDGKTKEECDAIFLEAMEAYGVPLWKRIGFYMAVRLFGGKAWRGCRADDANEKFDVDFDEVVF